MQPKELIRDAARRARKNQPDKSSVSKRITERLLSMPEFRRADHVMWYVDIRDEVRTTAPLMESLETRAEALIPVCDGDQLRVFRLSNPSELAPGAFGILEPRPDLRADASRFVDSHHPDLIVVPGVAFDTRGGRIGYGRGFYDRFFATIDPSAILVGLAFECQIWDQVPVEEHDIPIDWLITEERMIQCQRSLGVRASSEDC